MTSTERTDILVVGSGFGGAIAAYHLAAGGARVVVLERGPWLSTEEFEHDFKLGSSSTRIFEFVAGDGMSVLSGNCVGGAASSISPRRPARRGSFSSAGEHRPPDVAAAITRETLDPWYDRVNEALPISLQSWNEVTYAGRPVGRAVTTRGGPATRCRSPSTPRLHEL